MIGFWKENNLLSYSRCESSQYWPYPTILSLTPDVCSRPSDPEFISSEACPHLPCLQTRTIHSSCSFSPWSALCLHIASPLSPAEQGRGGKLELTGQGGRSSMPFCGPSEPPSGKGTQGSRAGGQAGTQWEAASWGEGWRKRRLKQNSFTDELTFMELPSVSRSGLKLQRRNSG